MPGNRKRFLIGLLVAIVLDILIGGIFRQGPIGLLIGVMVGARIAQVANTKDGALFGAWLGVLIGPFIGLLAAGMILTQVSYPLLMTIGIIAFDVVVGAIIMAAVSAGLGGIIGFISNWLREHKAVLGNDDPHSTNSNLDKEKS